jgi:UDP-N-acetyl-D-galactosamine dehydrogenase
MGIYIANEVIKLLVKSDQKVKGAKILILGITFKENCPDVRNTKVVDLILHLKDFGVDLTIYDPWANPEEVKHEYNLSTINQSPIIQFDAIVLAVAHKQFLSIDLDSLRKPGAPIYDVKGVLGDKATASL